jgi:hypothetical protein
MFIGLISYKLTLLVLVKTYLDMTNYFRAFFFLSGLKKHNPLTKVQV